MIKSKNNHLLYWQHTTEHNQVLEIFVYKTTHNHVSQDGSTNVYYALKYIARCGKFAHELSDLFESESDLDNGFNVIHTDSEIRKDCTMMFVGLIKAAKR